MPNQSPHIKFSFIAPQSMVACTVATVATVLWNSIPAVCLGYVAMSRNPSQQRKLKWHYHSVTKKTFNQEESIFSCQFPTIFTSEFYYGNVKLTQWGICVLVLLGFASKISIRKPSLALVKCLMLKGDRGSDSLMDFSALGSPWSWLSAYSHFPLKVMWEVAFSFLCINHDCATILVLTVSR